MLVATFRLTTEWARQSVTYDEGQFSIEDGGPVSAAQIIEHDREGHIDWAYSGLREWVVHLAEHDAAPLASAPESDDVRSPKTRHIRLTKGQVALVDETDYAELSRYTWQAQKWQSRGETHFYANRSDPVTHRTIGMHVQIMGFPQKPLEVHHVNNDSLDNRRSNLRVDTRELNQRTSNAGWGESRFRGVTWDKDKGLWKAHTRIRKVHYDLGYFPTEEEAGRALDRKRREVYGDLVQPLVEDDYGDDPPTLF